MSKPVWEYIRSFCIGVDSVIGDFCTRAHPLAIACVLMGFVSVKMLVPEWVMITLTLVIFVPAMTGIVCLMVDCWASTSSRKALK